jgi:predicted NAD/FAD-dependent oxidoreductase
MMKVLSTAVIGAGIAGLTAANRLRDAGQIVTVFDKSRGVGGRAATRRAEPSLSFNHGLQYLRAASLDFDARLKQWCDAGVLRLWTGAMVRLPADGNPIVVQTPFNRYVPVSGASAIGKHLAAGLDVRTDCAIHGIDYADERWSLLDAAGVEIGVFDRLVIAIPPQQAIALLGEFDAVSQQITAVTMKPVWAVMVGLNGSSGHAFDAARVEAAPGEVSPVVWMMRTPGVAAECWSLHLDVDWTRSHLEQSPAAVLESLKPRLKRLFSTDSYAYLAAHRWRYALSGDPLGQPCIHDPVRSLTLVGDWCLGDRAEDAWLSGRSVPVSTATA